MNIAVFLKNNLKNIPPSIGQKINILPYEYRPGIGKIYKTRKQEIRQLELANKEEKQDFVFKRVKSLVDFSYKHIPFYRTYYDTNSFHPDDLMSFGDIQKIPIITKSILNQSKLEQRSYKRKGRYIVNTGGSSGTPFGFYIEPDSIGHEWAHMHTIWEKLGYKTSDFKLGFGGRSDVNNFVDYDVVRNTFAIDIYASYSEICKRLKQILKKYHVNYLHGYPSSIYDFAIYCETFDQELTSILKEQLKGAFLGSEYPHKYYRDKIETVFDIKTISWYGHTERAVLAYEKERPFNYSPFLSYGFSEAILNEENEYNLVSTSYYNYASPLIRYNTEDIIEDPIVQNGILDSFLILKGRNGEFVVDKDNKSINLTGLIFGRHHEIFNYANFVQVKQIRKGVIEIVYVGNIAENKAASLFDSNNLNFDITFKRVNEPIRSVSGKVSLLIK
ncbi:hypothetical protein [Massilibacteroides sp.]|uniref:hypothetical protein n=1 Tax=Massilibacteroides sp. TaxID=2034766 RepID=UPI0026350124|nr:hypothetical protein [Massilibacteroides sp.]MDD4515969.1 hypothetical protein [Massilibacteroides sp.]